jgi:endonuclease/exonuclease/phosphatase family metal-dependent hydrolase
MKHTLPTWFRPSRRNFLVTSAAVVASVWSPRNSTADDPPASTSSADALTVLSCNIRLPLKEDEVPGNGWDARREFCADVIIKQQPHLIGLQECRQAQLEYLLSRLDGWQAVGLPHPDLDFSRVNPILFPQKRFDLLSAGGFWVSETPHIEGSKSWDSARARFVNWAQLVDRTTKAQFRIWNTHLDHIGKEARERGAKLIVEAAQALPESLPQLLLGDFNSPATYPGIKAIKDAGWIDTYSAIHGDADPGFTAHHFIGPEHAKTAKHGHKIDWIFCRPGTKTVAADIIRDQRDGRFPSDHYFISATVILPRA